MTQTDQINCYNESGLQIPCAGTGQDGDTRSGISWPVPRMVCGGELVEDRLTRLVWPKDAGLSEFPMTWQEGFEWVADMNRSSCFGLSNWRLPSREELFSLVSQQRINPAVVNSELFVNIFNGYYWTSTPCAQWPRQAWYIHLGGGRVVKGMKEQSYMVWPVHDQGPGSARLKPGETPDERLRFNETATTALDLKTGLTWTRNANICEKSISWQDALDTIHQMNVDTLYGYRDWRLPTIRELDSLTHMEKWAPAIAGRDLFSAVRPFYWSSTTSVFEPGYAWTLYTEDGNIGVGYKPDPEFHLWPVRGGWSTP